MIRYRALMLALLTALAACTGNTTAPQGNQTAPGADRTAKTAALETGANLMQGRGPVSKISMHLVGFHPSKGDPKMQMESHHFCNQMNEDFAQCVLYDGDADEARLHGIEYIISEKLYATLPTEEKAYWHPHNFEILSGQLRMPNLPDVAEKEALRGKMNGYGKTWHTWKTGVYQQQADQLPLGPPHLAWSFNYDGEDMPGLIEARDKRMRLDTADERRDRADMASLARPQGGVDAMKGQFPNAKGTAAGVTDNGDVATRPVPHMMMQPAASDTFTPRKW